MVQYRAADFELENRRFDCLPSLFVMVFLSKTPAANLLHVGVLHVEWNVEPKFCQSLGTHNNDYTYHFQHYLCLKETYHLNPIFLAMKYIFLCTCIAENFNLESPSPT